MEILMKTAKEQLTMDKAIAEAIARVYIIESLGKKRLKPRKDSD
jgi:hypothetical protein